MKMKQVIGLCTYSMLFFMVSVMACSPDKPINSKINTIGLTYQKLKHNNDQFDLFLLNKGTSPTLFWQDEKGDPIKSFEVLNQFIERQGHKLVFAINAGIYEAGPKPLGLHIENGKTLVPLNTSDGDGNFHLKPNGVFYVDQAGCHITTTESAAGNLGTATYACQSGPMLVNDGEIHPMFNAESKNVYTRSGVGIISHGEFAEQYSVVFVQSHTPINLYTFASLFKEKLGCDNALYLDGAINGVYYPTQNMHSKDYEYAAMWAVVE